MLDLGTKVLGKRSYLLHFDHLCVYPEAALRKLLDFLKSKADIDRLTSLVEFAPRQRRRREHAMSSSATRN